MSAVSERYDRAALDYERYWGPVLEKAALRLLDDCERFVPRSPSTRSRDRPAVPTILDVGTGTG